MTTTVLKLKKSSVSGNIPAAENLEYGELAINFADGKLFYKNSSNEIKSFIDSELVQSLVQDLSLDSSQVTNLVDSAYIQARQLLVDSNSVIGIINATADSTYVQSRQDFAYSSLTGTPNILDSTDVSGIITTDVNQTFVNNLNIDAFTLGGNDSSYYLNYNNFTNTPNVLDSAQIISLTSGAGAATQDYVDAAIAALPDSAQVSTIISSDVDKAFVDALNIDADTLDGQQGTYYLDYNNFTNTPTLFSGSYTDLTNKPNILDSTDVNTLVDAGIANVIDAAPASLDTLNELAAALNDDANFASTVTAQIAALPDSAQVSQIITNDVDKAFVDALGVDAETLGGHDSSYFVNQFDLAAGGVQEDVEVADQTVNIGETVYTIVDSDYVQQRQTGANVTLYEYIASEGQTTFSDSDINGNILDYSNGAAFVHYNGVLLLTSDYTSTDGSSITLDIAADSGSVIAIMATQLVNGNVAFGGYGSGVTSQDSAGAGSSGSITGVWYGDTAVFARGAAGKTAYDNLNTIDITTTGNSNDFGDLSTRRSEAAAGSNGSRGLYIGGNDWNTTPYTVPKHIKLSSIDFITFASSGNATSSGSLTQKRYRHSAASNNENVIVFGGHDGSAVSDIIFKITTATLGNATNSGSIGFKCYTAAGAGNNDIALNIGGLRNGSSENLIKSVDPATDGDAVDFGRLSDRTYFLAATGSTTRCLIAGGYAANSGMSNGIEYVTFATPGNATDFGDLTKTKHRFSAASNNTRAVFDGGYDNTDASSFSSNVIDYVTIGIQSNAVDFGDMNYAGWGSCAASGD